jgi:hypothetical protein
MILPGFTAETTLATAGVAYRRYCWCLYQEVNECYPDPHYGYSCCKRLTLVGNNCGGRCSIYMCTGYLYGYCC